MWLPKGVEYMAGFFDGEGSVIMQKNFQVFAVISQSNLELLKGFQSQYGGNIQVQTGNKLSKLPHFQWRLSRKVETKKFLEAIQDHVVVKRQKVKLALEMLDLLQDTGKRLQAPNGHFVASDTVPKQRIYEQFKALPRGI